MKFFILLLVSITPIFSAQASNKDYNSVVYPYRDIHKPIIQLNPKQKIIVAALPRTGSTLLYMVFQYLFETKLGPFNSFHKQVVKLHSPVMALKYAKRHKDTFVAVAVRNPIDAAFSKIMKVKSPPKDVSIVKQKLACILEKKTPYYDLRQLIKKVPPKKLLVHHFEKFTIDLSDLLFEIEQKFHCKIPLHEKEKIKRIFSKEEVRKIAEKYRGFSQYDPITNVHGNHILEDQHSIENILSENDRYYLSESIRDVLNLLGYR